MNRLLFDELTGVWSGDVTGESLVRDEALKKETDAQLMLKRSCQFPFQPMLQGMIIWS